MEQKGDPSPRVGAWFTNPKKISRLFLKYTIPGVAGLLFLGIQSVIDGVILGRFVGANALASVNLILPCYSLMTALSIVIGVGARP